MAITYPPTISQSPNPLFIAEAVSASIAIQNGKFAEAKEIAAADVAAIESHIDLLRKQFPSWVK